MHVTTVNEAGVSQLRGPRCSSASGQGEERVHARCLQLGKGGTEGSVLSGTSRPLGQRPKAALLEKPTRLHGQG